jgi:hypothetical protein
MLLTPFLFKSTAHKKHTAHKSTQPKTMPSHAPQDHHTEALHPTRENHWKYHWFDTGQLPPPYQAKTVWKPSCDDDGCGYWNRCYDCNDFNATLLVDKAEFLARKQLEEEHPETPHPHPALLRPHQFNYGTDIEDENDPERKKHQNWLRTKDRRTTVIALNIATDKTKTSNKEDLATLKQVKAELLHRRYHYDTYLSCLTPPNKENKPPPQKKKRKKTTETSPPHGRELLLGNGDGSTHPVGYALPSHYKSYQFSP